MKRLLADKDLRAQLDDIDKVSDVLGRLLTSKAFFAVTPGKGFQFTEPLQMNTTVKSAYAAYLKSIAIKLKEEQQLVVYFDIVKKLASRMFISSIFAQGELDYVVEEVLVHIKSVDRLTP